MAEGSIRQEFTLKNIDETRNYFIKEMKQNELISKKYEKICQLLRYIEHLFILASAVTGCVSISAFLSLVSFFCSCCKLGSRNKNLCNNCSN